MHKTKEKRISKGKYLKPPIIPSVNHDEQYPVFSFRFLQDTFSVNTCNIDQLRLFIEKLHNISQITWGKWKLAQHKGIGYEKIARNSIDAPIPQNITDDIQYFLSFRFHNGRCVGFRDGVIFNILWIDGSFKLYEH